MARIRKYGKYVLVLLVLFVAAQFCVSMLARTKRVRGYLIAHLEQAFGRPVQAGRLSLQLLPSPSVDVESISVGEDPAFGSEYFLRADRMTASFRWAGLLRGRFDFGTMSLTRPSLILARNAQGRWNLEGWLPRARIISRGALPSGPQLPLGSTHNLQAIEIDDGRLNFKLNQEKSPFAFINVSGRLEQVSSGKWRLRLEAVPWRSGVTLQSAGLLQVRGDLAGTSTRLRPAQIHVHWEKASMADLFRLATGNDFGVRGIFSMDADASTGQSGTAQATVASESADTAPWQISLQARTAQIHRWDLTERSDNPSTSLNVQGIWDVAAGNARVEHWSLDLPHSRLEGTAALQTTVPLDWSARVDSAVMQAQDLLAWYRAFRPGVAEQLSADSFFNGSLGLSGWPMRLQNVSLSSAGGVLHVPGLPEPAHFDSFRAETVGHQFRLIPVTLFLGSTGPATTAISGDAKAPEKNPAGVRARLGAENNIEIQFQRDLLSRQDGLGLALHLANADAALKLASAFGKPLNHGWELTGGVDGKAVWDFDSDGKAQDWNASLTLSRAQLQAAGLNLPLKLSDVNIAWVKGKRRVSLTQAEAFGSTWTGTILETASADADQPRWQFNLHADELDAAELDRWIGPRSRPNWLQKLLPSVLRNNNVQAQPNELLRRIFAEGQLSANSVTFEKFKLANLHANLTLRYLQLDARDVQAKWADGALRAALHADFSPTPKYDLSAAVEAADLAQIPWTPPGWAERWSGSASGKIHLSTQGVGRDDLLRQMAGRGEFKISSAEFHGWDVPASLEDGVLRLGISNWTGGSGEFNLSESIVTLQNVQLSLPHGRTQLSATLGPGPAAQFSFSPAPAEKRGASTIPVRLLRVIGPLDAPQLSFATSKTLTPQP